MVPAPTRTVSHTVRSRSNTRLSAGLLIDELRPFRPVTRPSTVMMKFARTKGRVRFPGDVGTAYRLRSASSPGSVRNTPPVSHRDWARRKGTACQTHVMAKSKKAKEKEAAPAATGSFRAALRAGEGFDLLALDTGSTPGFDG